MIYFLTDLIKFYCLMKLYEFKNIKIDLVLTEDIIPEDKLQEIIQSDDIIKLARKKTYEHLLRAR
ncbi:type III secretion system LEE stator protein EspL, partial [Escherichia coli]|nr:type III secretion system LEE stator protein EspL [Escherichia coli]